MPVDFNAAQSLRRWALEFLCPYWQARVLAPEGGFYESLDTNGEPDRSPHRSILNQARLSYVFSHAATLSGNAQLRVAAEHGFAYLLHCYEVSSQFAGWHRISHVDGRVIDPVCDTYDQAFVVFAMAYYYQLSGAPQALHLAEQTYSQLETVLADSEAGGFQEVHPFNSALPRRQNPHMHLLEASLAMHRAGGGAHWLVRAQGLVALFESHFFDQQSGSLAEYFDATWQTAQGDFAALRDIGQIREPGHQFEWVWLLQQYVQQDPQAKLDHYIDAMS